jgi:hypothetical protein
VADTDEDGIFRVSDVSPGVYYLLAHGVNAIRPSKTTEGDVYAPTLYPSATRVDQALQLAVGAGQEIFGIDIMLTAARTHVVSGRVLQPDGSPARGLLQVTSLSGLGESANLLGAHMGPLSADGHFDVRNLVPGEYLVLVVGGVPSVPWNGPLVAQVVTVDRDLTGLELLTEPPARLEGRIVGTNGDPPPFDARALDIRTHQRWPGGTRSPGVAGLVQADGTFVAHSPAREVWLGIRNLPSPWIVESVRLDGTLVTDEAFTVAPGSQPRLDVVVTERSGGLHGLVTTRGSRPVGNALVLLFPQDRALWGVERRTYTTFTRSDGSYGLSGLVTGDYRAVADDALSANSWHAPEAHDLLWSVSTYLRLREGETRNEALTLTIAPPGLLEP